MPRSASWRGGGYVVLDTALTPELEAEGLARDVIRAVQDTRKAAGLDVSDRIHLSIVGDSDRDIAALLAHEVHDRGGDARDRDAPSRSSPSPRSPPPSRPPRARSGSSSLSVTTRTLVHW